MIKGRFSLLTIIIVSVILMFLISIFKRNPIEPIRVVILNGSGDKNLNRFLIDYLRFRNVDIIYSADIPPVNVNTVLVDRYSRKCYYAKKIASYLKMRNYISIVDSTFTEHVILILGKDVGSLRIIKRRKN